LSLKNDKDAETRRTSDPSDPRPASDASRKMSAKKPKPELGGALRSIYQRTVEEAIPAEMLDLLGKLG
jgi:hypothetical protein